TRRVACSTTGADGRGWRLGPAGTGCDTDCDDEGSDSVREVVLRAPRRTSRLRALRRRAAHARLPARVADGLADEPRLGGGARGAGTARRAARPARPRSQRQAAR